MDCFAPLAMTISLNKNKRIVLNAAPARQLLRPREHRADRRIARSGENTGPDIVDAAQERISGEDLSGLSQLRRYRWPEMILFDRRRRAAYRSRPCHHSGL